MAVCQGNCQNCNSSCNWHCNSCDSCNICNSSCEGSCENNKQLVSNTSIGTFCFRKNSNGNRLKGGTEVSNPSDADLFLTANEWNKLISKIESAYRLSSDLPDTGADKYQGKDIKAGVQYNNEFMTAFMFDGAITRMKYATNGSTSPGNSGKQKEDVIYASYFRDLEDYFNNSFKIYYCNSCNNCNSCNSSCQGCNSCNNCQSCQGGDSCCQTPKT